MKSSNFTRPLFFAFLLLGTAAAFSQGTYIIRYEAGGSLTSFLKRNGLALRKSVPNQPVHLAVDLLNRTPSAVITDVDEDEEDARIEVNTRVVLPEAAMRTSPINMTAITAATRDRSMGTYFGTPAMNAFTTQAAARQTNALLGRQMFGAFSSIVAVVDTGVDPTHPFLRPRLVPGFDFLRERSGLPNEIQDLPADQQAIINPTTTPILERVLFRINPTTTPILEKHVQEALTAKPLPIGFGHGTMVAGAVRMTAPQARIMPLKAFGSNGQGWLFDVIRSVYFAESRGARVINLSLSSSTPSPELERAVEYVSKLGVVTVASAGNSGLLTSQVTPASIPWVTGVASVTSSGARSAFSNHGPDIVRVAAPGEAVLLPFPGARWAGGWGTSFAAPQAAGVASLMFQYNSSATYSDFQSILSKSTPLPTATLGHGLLNVVESMNALR